jgi:hypothetical protein
MDLPAEVLQLVFENVWTSLRTVSLHIDDGLAGIMGGLMGTLSCFPNAASSRNSTTLPGDTDRVPEGCPSIFEQQEAANQDNI